MDAKWQKTLTSQKPPQPRDEIQLPEPLKQFDGKTPREFFLGQGVTPQQIDGAAGMVHGFVGDFGIPIPNFAKEASKQFWKNFLGKDFNPQTSVENAGVVSRLLELIGISSASRPQSPLEKKIIPAAEPLSDILQNEARKLTTVETAEFYAGRARADTIWEKMNDQNYMKMVKRAPLYSALAIAWTEFEKFHSQGEAERWLRDKKIIGQNFDSGEVRAVFRIVGLNYGKRPGRPKKTKTDA
jgi:hypothetical protein